MASKYEDQRRPEGDTIVGKKSNSEKVLVEEPKVIGKKVEEKTIGGRRPMNAFLIFCKRQRNAVRRRYPNLENRAVTRVLGEWWTVLSTAQKESYICLASQYKEAYMKANPEFKWNKMPAVTPSRLVANRPKAARLNSSQLTQGQIVPGKLADESQLGGLSSLLEKSVNTIIGQVPKPPKKRYLEENYSDKDSNCMQLRGGCYGDDEDEERKKIKEENLISGQREKENKEAVAARMRIWRKTLLSDNKEGEEMINEEKGNAEKEDSAEVVNGGEMNNNKVEECKIEVAESKGRAARACKGRRYLEFMESNLSSRRRQRWEIDQEVPGSTGNKRKLRERRGNEESENKKNCVSKEIMVEKKLVNEELKNLKAEEPSSDLGSSEEKKEESHSTEDYMNHLINAISFDQELSMNGTNEEILQNGFNLEEKIYALPALSIEEFHYRKRTKKGLKILSPVLNEVKEAEEKKSLENLTPVVNNNNSNTAINNNINSVVNIINKVEDNNNVPFCTPQFNTVDDDGVPKDEKVIVIGSRKRKLRRQSIRRLEPEPESLNYDDESSSYDIIALETLADIAARKPRLSSV